MSTSASKRQCKDNANNKEKLNIVAQIAANEVSYGEVSSASGRQQRKNKSIIVATSNQSNDNGEEAQEEEGIIESIKYMKNSEIDQESEKGDQGDGNNVKQYEKDDYGFIINLNIYDVKKMKKEDKMEILDDMINTSSGSWFFRKNLFLHGGTRDDKSEIIITNYGEYLIDFDFQEEKLTTKETSEINLIMKTILLDAGSVWEKFKMKYTFLDRQIRDRLRYFLRHLNIDLVKCRETKSKFWIFEENATELANTFKSIPCLSKENYHSLLYILGLATAYFSAPATALIDRQKIKQMLFTLCNGDVVESDDLIGLLTFPFLGVIAAIMDFDSIQENLTKGPQAALSTKRNVHGAAIQMIKQWEGNEQATSVIQGIKFEEMVKLFNKTSNRKKGGRTAGNEEPDIIKHCIDRYQCPKIFNL